MKVLTGTQMAQIDKKAINDLKIDGLILMENAGIKAYDHILEIIEDWDEEDQPFKNVVVVAGKGNNGGDGFVIARHLLLSDIETRVYALAAKKDYKGDALKNYQALENFTDIITIDKNNLEDLRDEVLESSIIIDALLGTGIKGPIEGLYEEVINIINESDNVIFSIDVPSGVDADTGKVGNVAVEADYTETFAAPKLGLFMYPGADCVGELEIANIGIPEHLIKNSDSNVHLVEEHYVFDLIPVREDNSNKGSFGKVLVIAGSATMTGAGILSSMGVLKIGAGLCTLATPESLTPYYAGAFPEITFMPLVENSSKEISLSAVTQVVDKLDSYQAVILGPGIGTNQDTVGFVEKIAKAVTDKKIPLVVDADGLNCISQLSDVKLSNNAVMTPHPKELSRLLNVDVNEILQDKLKYIQQAKEKFNCNVVLKGSNSIIASKDSIFINITGNSGLATAGTGDVLAGMIAGLTAQGMSSIDAAVAGVYIHGLAGDLAAEDLTEYSVIASDVVNYISDALSELGLL